MHSKVDSRLACQPLRNEIIQAGQHRRYAGYVPLLATADLTRGQDVGWHNGLESLAERAFCWAGSPQMTWVVLYCLDPGQAAVRRRATKLAWAL